MAKYSIGLDFGTLSARCVVVDIANGREVGAGTAAYAHGVMDKALPDGQALPPDWALQHPQDYTDCLRDAVRAAMEKSSVAKEDIVGIGVDFTGCTVVATDENMVPLCLKPEYAHRPHAYVKLWKHHGAQAEADQVTRIAAERNEPFLARCGGKVSSESLLPKILQVLHEDPELFEAARFMEAGDWIVHYMTGSPARSACMAGYKAMWNKRDGFPSDDFFAAVDPRLEHVVDEKLGRDVRSVGTCAGYLTEKAAAELGLPAGIGVGVCTLDAHVAVPPARVSDGGQMLMIMGTSSCHLLLGKTERLVDGICGVVEDGAMPGSFCYEAGQCCVGDHFDWFVHNGVPAAYAREAEEKGMNIHALLTEKAAALAPGESGLIALDWWNGNRSVLVDAQLSGLMIGMTLTTRPEEVYRALIEATAYGTRVIVDNFEKNGLAVTDIRACGGIARKNAFLMQLYADVLGRRIEVVSSDQLPALGSAILGAAASGRMTLEEAVDHMGDTPQRVYTPDERNHAVYDRLFAEYEKLHDLFGRGGMDTMKTLKQIRKEAYTK